MESYQLEAVVPKVYGAVTVGERGQIVIPVEARKELELKPASKLIVFSGFHKGSMILAKAELVGEFIAKANAKAAEIAELLQNQTDDAESEN